MRSNLARKSRSVGTADHDAAMETQSDMGAAVHSQSTAVVSLDDDDGDLVNAEEMIGLLEADGMESESSERPLMATTPTADRPLRERRAMRQHLQPTTPDDDTTPAVRVAEASPAQVRSQPIAVPGPPKKIVVVRDGAYTTYYAFLYYVSLANGSASARVVLT